LLDLGVALLAAKRVGFHEGPDEVPAAVGAVALDLRVLHLEVRRVVLAVLPLQLDGHSVDPQRLIVRGVERRSSIDGPPIFGTLRAPRHDAINDLDNALQEDRADLHLQARRAFAAVLPLLVSAMGAVLRIIGARLKVGYRFHLGLAMLPGR
jgi:hypothetical protein